MNRLPLLTITILLSAPLAFAQQLPPPQNPADAKPNTPPQGPALAAPQNAPAARGLARPQPQNPPAANAPQKNPGKPREFFAARRQAQIDRKEAQKQRMRDFQAARAIEQQKLYQDWHERYLADTPVRVEFYRAQARAYEADVLAWRSPYFYAAPAPFIVPVIYAPVIYTPIYQPPLYGTFFSWNW